MKRFFEILKKFHEYMKWIESERIKAMIHSGQGKV